jgi:hypothetical protein
MAMDSGMKKNATMPFIRSGIVESSAVFHVGGPPSISPIPPNSISPVPSPFGSMPAYSRMKTGRRAPMIDSAEAVRPPSVSRQTFGSCTIERASRIYSQKHSATTAAHFLHCGKFRGSVGSGVGIGTWRRFPSSSYSLEDPTTRLACDSVKGPLSLLCLCSSVYGLFLRLLPPKKRCCDESPIVVS